MKRIVLTVTNEKYKEMKKQYREYVKYCTDRKIKPHKIGDWLFPN